MRKYARIVDHENLVRDMETKAILQTDLTFVRQHEKRMQELQKEENREREINKLKEDIAEIKNLLCQLLKK